MAYFWPKSYKERRFVALGQLKMTPKMSLFWPKSYKERRFVKNDPKNGLPGAPGRGILGVKKGGGLNLEEFFRAKTRRGVFWRDFPYGLGSNLRLFTVKGPKWSKMTPKMGRF